MELAVTRSAGHTVKLLSATVEPFDRCRLTHLTVTVRCAVRVSDSAWTSHTWRRTTDAAVVLCALDTLRTTVDTHHARFQTRPTVVAEQGRCRQDRLPARLHGAALPTAAVCVRLHTAGRLLPHTRLISPLDHLYYHLQPPLACSVCPLRLVYSTAALY